MNLQEGCRHEFVRQYQNAQIDCHLSFVSKLVFRKVQQHSGRPCCCPRLWNVLLAVIATAFVAMETPNYLRIYLPTSSLFFSGVQPLPPW